MTMTSAADEHRVIAGDFTERVRGVRPEAWDDPAPCEGWVARDVVRHLVEWFPAFLKAGAGVDLPQGPPVDEDRSLRGPCTAKGSRPSSTTRRHRAGS